MSKLAVPAKTYTTMPANDLASSVLVANKSRLVKFSSAKLAQRKSPALALS
jgi:hypothetical protein